MRTFYLFRHGDTYETKNHLDYGKNIFKSPIILESQVYIKKMGSFLKNRSIDLFVSSDIARCQQTSKIISEITKVPFVVEKMITEFDPDSKYTPETFEHFVSRIKIFLSNVQKSNFHNIAACMHGSGIACLSNLIRSNNFSDEEFLDYPPPGVLWVIREEDLVEKDFR